ncbi:glycosyl transferase family 25 [Roseiconus nitratireducens]|uniref:Glycosyl transferase family 25 n=1 Tax=Roseiconus nitratireducens TaxID=2605748 RepID=A0A5M6D263_9BACT|nr:glycosyl transferase family 25 [Roseiconus nitratireducens]
MTTVPATSTTTRANLAAKQSEKQNSLVERCFLINLDGRHDRLREWFDQLPKPWPFPKPERFAAIDGRRVPPPTHWRAGNGAWGCYRSHCLILEKCLSEGIDSYVVFEDDAGFCNDFAKRFQKFVCELPDDWGLAYLGGQHLYSVAHPPVRISEHVYLPYNVNRTHAFMVRGRSNMVSLYRHLHSRDWKKANHIDHHLGRMIQRRYHGIARRNVGKGSVAVYAPDRWLVGQLPTRSNISGRRWSETRFFNDAVNVDHEEEPFFAVLGPHRSGTSCVAMICHHLGVHMGNQLGGFEATGGGEAVGLMELCEAVMKFPAADPTISDSDLTYRLKKFFVGKKSEAVRDETVAGGKYPHLCRFADHIHKAIGNSMRIIAVDRPIEASIRSLQSRSRKHRGNWYAATPQQCEQLQRSLLKHREDFIAAHPDIPVHRIDFASLTSNTKHEVERLVKFLGIAPDPDEIDAAVGHVNPNLRKHG